MIVKREIVHRVGGNCWYMKHQDVHTRVTDIPAEVTCKQCQKGLK
jgi:hypothetical protein